MWASFTCYYTELECFPLSEPLSLMRIQSTKLMFINLEKSIRSGKGIVYTERIYMRIYCDTNCLI